MNQRKRLKKRATLCAAFGVLPVVSLHAASFGVSPVNLLHAAGFDCEKAHTQVEQLVCSNEVLSVLDAELARVYVSSRKEASPRQARSIVAGQSTWLKRTRAGCSDLQCLIVVYVSRIDELITTAVASTNRLSTEKDSSEDIEYRRAMARDCFEKAKSIPEDLMDVDGGLQYDLEEASTACSQAVEVDNTNEKAFLYRGMALAALGNPDTGIADFTRAIQLDANDPQPYFRRGEQYARYDNDFLMLGRAIADLTRATSLSPQLTNAYLVRGEAYGNLAVHARYASFGHASAEYAVADFTRVIEVEPSNEHAIWNRGFFSSMVGNYRQAVKDFTTLIGINPAEGPYYYNRGEAFASLNSREEAIADFTKAIALFPAYSNPYESRGQLYLQAHRYQMAIDDFTKALVLFPDGYNVYYSRALAYDALGDKARAVADWKTGASQGDSRARDVLWGMGLKP